MATQKLADRLLLHRRQLDLDQEELARRAEVDRSYISSLERGRKRNPSVDLVEALARALGIRPEYLAGWTEDPLGEDLPASEREGRVVWQVANPEEYQRFQQLLEIFSDIPPERQPFALQLIDTFRRSQGVRIVGG